MESLKSIKKVFGIFFSNNISLKFELEMSKKINCAPVPRSIKIFILLLMMNFELNFQAYKLYKLIILNIFQLKNNLLTIVILYNGNI